MRLQMPFHSPDGGCSTAFRYTLAAAVSAVWTIGYVLSWIDGAEHPAPSTPVSIIMASVVAWAFSGEVKKSLNRKDLPDEAPDE